ncbi:unnamed protein product [Allacma fusca]|uniref:Ketosynthase family 3 (KS3) domain-containing protein n=1 Tax=Allacma fusca TaxID=39272 RepID=A0A8J2KAY2_9HEXA|nr:unnamed protein product [Allacma fusca]
MLNEDQDWVISGMSGRFPESENLDIFWENLIQGKDMISENNRMRNFKHFEIPGRMGNIPFIEKFDASFFGVPGRRANTMDPKIRISLEVAFEAIVDAGLNPTSLDGARVGVFMTTTGNEAMDTWLRSKENASGNYVTGCYQSMLANRISYAFNFKGPSCVFDSACSASFSALQYAMLALKSGLCYCWWCQYKHFTIDYTVIV